MDTANCVISPGRQGTLAVSQSLPRLRLHLPWTHMKYDSTRMVKFTFRVCSIPTRRTAWRTVSGVMLVAWQHISSTIPSEFRGITANCHRFFIGVLCSKGTMIFESIKM